MGKISSQIKTQIRSQRSQPYLRINLDEGLAKQNSSQLPPKPGQKPTNVPRSITHEEAIRYLQELVEHPNGIEHLNLAPYRFRAMSQREREAAAIFEKEIEREDPTGKLRQRGEFMQYFRLRRNKVTGRMEVRANGPITYREGDKADTPPERMMVEGTFLCIHSHAEDGCPTSNFPSRGDFLESRTLRAGGWIKYDMVRIAANQYLHYDGSLPPRFSELYDAGPGYQTPPPSPEFMPPPLPPYVPHRKFNACADTFILPVKPDLKR